MPFSSRIPGFYRNTVDERRARLRHLGALTDEGCLSLQGPGLSIDIADAMIENVVGTLALPTAVAVNFTINGMERLIPMTIEEPSVVAAASHMAKLASECGGFFAETDEPIMIGQLQLAPVSDVEACVRSLAAALPELEALGNSVHPRLIARGGGIRGFEIRPLVYEEPGHSKISMVILHVLVDCRDAMGANLVNTLVEFIAPRVEQITGETAGLRILSNLADRRLSRARVEIPVVALNPTEGLEVAEQIVAAWQFAWVDPYRAATHNKGAMNGIDALAVATGNDWRAIEAGVHAWCCRDGQYRPVSRWSIAERDGAPSLVGTLEAPLPFSTVGERIQMHPTVRTNLSMLGSPDSRELASVAAAVGLAQNLGALKALATEGIQAGHMRMHARLSEKKTR